MFNRVNPFSLSLAFMALSVMIAPSFASEADDAKARELIGATGIIDADLEGAGRIGDTDIYYGHFCTGSYSGTLIFVRADEGESPQVWKQEDRCIRNVSWRDIDGDGAPEIRTREFGGGSGVLQVTAVFLRWQDTQDSPEEIIRFVESSYSSWDGVYARYGFEPQEAIPITMYQDNFLPLGALCSSVDDCGLIKRKTFCIESCEMELPNMFLNDPGWPTFVEALATDGYLPGNLAPSGKPPEVTQEKQEAFDTWLTE